MKNREETSSEGRLNPPHSHPASPVLADCHLHFEGSLPASVVARLARRAGHPFADPAAFADRRSAISSPQSFLELYAEVCRLFRVPEDYENAARELPAALSTDGVGYAEIYVSPEIFRRIGLDPAACLEGVESGLREGARGGGAVCKILLDTVRHWGPDAAERVLDLYESRPWKLILGFGMGGDEAAEPAARFADAYLRARSLGLKTSVHAGEWSDARSMREALDVLRPDRIDHGIAAAADAELLARLAEEGTILCVAASGNVLTGAVPTLAAHPIPRLLGAGVRVALSADDPLLFSTSTLAEYRKARDAFALDEHTVRQLAENAWRAAFCSPEEKRRGLASLASWRLPAS
jgi:adenosine deaminase